MLAVLTAMAPTHLVTFLYARYYAYRVAKRWMRQGADAPADSEAEGENSAIRLKLKGILFL